MQEPSDHGDSGAGASLGPVTTLTGIQPQFQCSCPAGPCGLDVETAFCAMGPLCCAEDMASDLLPGTDVTRATVTMGAPITAAASTQTSTPLSQPAILPNR